MVAWVKLGSKVSTKTMKNGKTVDTRAFKVETVKVETKIVDGEKRTTTTIETLYYLKVTDYLQGQAFKSTSLEQGKEDTAKETTYYFYSLKALEDFTGKKAEELDIKTPGGTRLNLIGIPIGKSLRITNPEKERFNIKGEIIGRLVFNSGHPLSKAAGKNATAGVMATVDFTISRNQAGETADIGRAVGNLRALSTWKTRSFSISGTNLKGLGLEIVNAPGDYQETFLTDDQETYDTLKGKEGIEIYKLSSSTRRAFLQARAMGIDIISPEQLEGIGVTFGINKEGA